VNGEGVDVLGPQGLLVQIHMKQKILRLIQSTMFYIGVYTGEDNFID
jgi:hypothetical protein